MKTNIRIIGTERTLRTCPVFECNSRIERELMRMSIKCVNGHIIGMFALLRYSEMKISRLALKGPVY